MNALLRLPPWLATTLLGLALAGAVSALGVLLRPLLGPLLLATLLHLLLTPWVDALQRRGLGRTPAIVLVLSVAMAALTWAVAALAPSLGEQMSAFVQRLPATWARLQTLLEGLDDTLRGTVGMGLPVTELLGDLRAHLGDWGASLLRQGSGLAAELLLWVLLAPLVTFFLLRDYRRVRNRLLGRLPNAAFEDALRIYHGVSSRLVRYVRGVLIQSSVVALVVGSGLALVGLPMAPLLGVVAGLFNLIPYLGPLLGALPPLLVALSLGLEPTQLGLVFGVLALAQLVDNLVVVPTVLARAADLHPLVALLGVIAAGRLFGAAGMILALPLLASARICLAGIHEGLCRRHAQVAPRNADMAGTSQSP